MNAIAQIAEMTHALVLTIGRIQPATSIAASAQLRPLRLIGNGLLVGPPGGAHALLFIPAGTIHSAKNVGGGNGAELATYVVEKGKPLLTLVK